MSTLRTNAILDASGGTTATVNGIPLRPGVLDPENRIINGAFDFWQRGTSFTANAYGADRWINQGNGGTVTMSQQSFTLGDTLGNNSPTFFLRQSVSGQSTSGNYGITTQLIESVRSYANQTITILGWARRSSGSGNMAVELEQNFGTGGSPSATVTAISPTTVTLTASWAPFAVVMTVPSITGKTLGSNNNHFLGLNFWSSAGSNYNARTNSLGLQTIGVDFWGIHIKQGTHTTSAVDLYRQPEFGPELERCQRYLEAVQISALMTAWVPAYSEHRGIVFWKTRKRAAPTTNTAAVSNYQPGGGSGTATIVNVNENHGIVISGSTASTFSTQWINSSGIILVDAEL